MASGSPRRRQILEEMGYKFEIVVPEVNEEIVRGESPEDHVLRVSRLKARKVSSNHPEDIVIGSDTVVVLENKILGKPIDKSDALKMLRDLSGKSHTVFSGISLLQDSKGVSLSRYDSTRVRFAELSDEQINNYIESGEPMDKAGAYGIQGLGSYLVDSYEGSLDTVIGFPSGLFKSMYKEVLSCQ